MKERLTGLSNSPDQGTENVDFDQIELTEEEVKEALRRGRERKFFEQQRAEYREKLNQAATQAKPNARELFEKLTQTKGQTGKQFEVTDWNRRVLFGLSLYFAEDPNFETKGYGSLSKGILLEGPQGTGKTHLMNFFAVNPHQSYRCVTTKQVGEHYAKNWERDNLDALTYYSHSHKGPFEYGYGHDVLGFCFGDLGSEQLRKSYGNETNVMEHIIFQRYENRLPFNQTHFTTNLNTTELQNMFGVRVVDRLNEMCNLFTLDGPSWRK